MGHLLSFGVKNKQMMTATENSANNAWNLNLNDGNQNNNSKTGYQLRLRPVSA